MHRDPVPAARARPRPGRVRAALLGVLLGSVALLALPATASARPVDALPEPLPGSMAAVGDSLSKAFDACGFYRDCARRSWSTGTDAGVHSQYRRLAVLDPAVAGNVHDDAHDGAPAAALVGQLQEAVDQGVDYVTVLVGANDVCTSSEGTMTPVPVFRAELERAFDVVRSQRPQTRLFVASIPDVEHLWEVAHHDLQARLTWRVGKICPALLAHPDSTSDRDTARRARVRQRVVDDNAQLAQVCAETAHCRYDDGAVFGYPFRLGELSRWDYFHPNERGQAALADATWAAASAGFGW